MSHSPAKTVRIVVESLVRTCLDHRAEWDRLDAAAGDGDMGTSLARGFAAVRDDWEALADLAAPELLSSVAALVEEHTGGSSGPLWAAGLDAAAEASRGLDDAPARTAAEMVRACTEAIAERGGAEVGDKTMLDALAPLTRAVQALVDAGASRAEVLHAAALAAVDGATDTAALVARRGRAAYVGERSVGVPDPGAVAVATIAAEVCAALGGGSVSLDTLIPPPAASSTSGSTERSAHGQLVNRPEDVVDESLRGFARAHADLVTWDPATRVVARAAGPGRGRVGLVSGGGSGHEPLHAGYVGHGMLTVAVPGGVFASPSTGAVLRGIEAADGGAGVLVVIKNYTGDVINFTAAVEEARARRLSVASAVVADDVAVDDVAVDDSTYTVGRRGTGGTVLVHKLAGALAESGAPLSDVAALAERVAASAVSFGVALSSCSLPGEEPLFDLPADAMEVGVGIHGEPGRSREPLGTAADVVRRIGDALLPSLPPGGPCVVLVSGLGATTSLELYLVYDELARLFDERGLSIVRSRVGNLITSLDMRGVLVTAMPLDDELTRLWDADVRTPAWGG